MGKGRVVLGIHKDHPADPYFWIELEGVKEPYKVYYGREGWTIDLNKKETRARYSVDTGIKEARASRVIGAIDIAGPTDEILKLIELAGYHGCHCGRIRPAYLHAPKKHITEVSQHLATHELLLELRKNDPTVRISHRQWPLDRPTRYDGIIEVEVMSSDKLVGSIPKLLTSN